MAEKSLHELDGEIVQFAERKERDVLWFTCPSCANGHGIAVSWNPPSLFPGGAVWRMTGSTLDDITLSPSINCDVPHTDEHGNRRPSDCKFHGWVQNGKVRW